MITLVLAVAVAWVGVAIVGAGLRISRPLLLLVELLTTLAEEAKRRRENHWDDSDR